MSTTQRQDFWRNDIVTPYTKQTYQTNPGPGQYTLGKKKDDDIKSRLLVEETVQVPFGHAAERACNKKNKVQGPGPGQYIDISNPLNSSVCKGLNKIREDRTLAESQGVKLGVFGSTTTRQDGRGWLQIKDGPGPGAYDTSSLMTKATMNHTVVSGLNSEGGENQPNRFETTLALEKKKPHSIFRSTTDRFNTTFSSKNPNIRMLTSQGRRNKIVAQNETGKHVYDRDAVFGVENQVTCLTHTNGWMPKQTRAGDFEVAPGRKVGFDATSPRFPYNQVFHGQSYKFDIPGPGRYVGGTGGSQNDFRPRTFSQPRSKNAKFAVVFNTSEKRFKVRPGASIYNTHGTQAIIGPGSYNLESTMIKKSHNMSLEQVRGAGPSNQGG